MPTTKPRIMVTETEELTEALKVAAEAWPEETSRSALVARLASAGAQQLATHSVEARAERRRAVLSRPQDRYAGMFPPGWLAELREDWPQ